MYRFTLRTMTCVAAFALMGGGAAFAQVVPGPADSGRVQQNQPIMTPAPASPGVLPVQPDAPSTEAPAGAEQVSFTLRGLEVEGSTVFSEDELLAPYRDRIGGTVTLKEIYAIADAIGTKYREEGYFLSRVEVPDQRISDGVVQINVTEGYIAQVELRDDADASNSVVRGYIDRITGEKPITTRTLESALLGLNDLPGLSFRAVLSAAPSDEKGASLLTLLPQKKEITGSVGFDNYGSKFLGPHQFNAQVNASLAPLHQTTLYGLTSMPTKELGFGTVRHTVAVAPDVTIEAEAGVTKAHPGYTLKTLRIDSRAVNMSVGVNYQLVRQRQENLSTGISLEGRNVSSDIFNTALTREHIRMVEAKLTYDKVDAWKGANVVNLTLTQGIDGLGSSERNDTNLSRSEAEPDFTKLELTASRLQEITPAWSALLQLNGQVATGPLYASEEFGYGGQNFGRAFDASELVGDQGGAGSVELRYQGWRQMEPINLEPYLFYDYGIVINEDTSQDHTESAASTGVGLRFASNWGQTGNIGIAFPIHQEILAPLYGGNSHSPRLSLQFSHNF